MKILKIFMIISVLVSVGWFSWNYYTGRPNQEKHERALLVFETPHGTDKTTLSERLYMYD